VSGQHQLVTRGASPVHAAAIVAALARHTREDGASPPPPSSPHAVGWLRTARVEAVERATRGRQAWGAT
jgi:hypothetical protein